MHFDQVGAAFSATFDWMSGKFSSMVEFFKGMGGSLGQFFIGLVDIVMFPIRALANGAIAAVNAVIAGINLIPGVDPIAPLTPFSYTGATALAGFQMGVEGAPPGFAVVGEKGPEIVEFAGGENVMKNENTEKLASAAKEGGIKNAASAELANLIAALEENTAAMTGKAKGTPGGFVATPAGNVGGGPVVKDVILRLNERELGRAIDQHLELAHNLRD